MFDLSTLSTFVAVVLGLFLIPGPAVAINAQYALAAFFIRIRRDRYRRNSAEYDRRTYGKLSSPVIQSIALAPIG